jgi:hypothetical protein
MLLHNSGVCSHLEEGHPRPAYGPGKGHKAWHNSPRVMSVKTMPKFCHKNTFQTVVRFTYRSSISWAIQNGYKDWNTKFALWAANPAECRVVGYGEPLQYNTEGEFHDQRDTKWIVIRGQLRGHNDTPFGGANPRPVVGHPWGVFGGFSYN